MAITVETGSASASSESFASVADCDTYFSLRGVTIWATLVTAEKEAALRRAADYMQQTYRLRWAGYRKTDTQALDWPRYDVPRPDGFAGNIGRFSGFASYYASDVVPSEVKKANIELALKAAAGELLEDTTQAIKSETVGPLQTVYQDYSTTTKRYPAIDRLLAPLLNGGGGIKIERA